MKSFGNVPYYITNDLSVTIAKSIVLQKFIQAGFGTDVPAVWVPVEQTLQQTYGSLGVTKDTEGPPGASRIDTVHSNLTGATAVTNVEYLRPRRRVRPRASSSHPRLGRVRRKGTATTCTFQIQQIQRAKMGYNRRINGNASGASLLRNSASTSPTSTSTMLIYYGADAWKNTY